ncbi:hypothetical protein [Dendronalium sp. ChiSLP03b]|uniref:hypothetical protein n=1 Tax=Dendronalium sp. ChiSLP03b TaxID=3075381 RepID=UPI002AD4AE1B|nr:hypothetical protein [Dendronalium sp. ChiSLP03b]MDZ8206488.1 hypothetical protein [Dendronalium sp. ChiSLP03b]
MMTIALERPKKTKSAQIRKKFGYPIINTDVQTQEFPPAFLDYLEQVTGSAIAENFQEHLPGSSRSKWFKQTWEECRNYCTTRPAFWTRSTNDAVDLATISIPKLLHERLQEAGTDFAVV